MGERNSCHHVTVDWLDHFRVSQASVSKGKAKSKASDMKMLFYSDEEETHNHKKVLLLASF